MCGRFAPVGNSEPGAEFADVIADKCFAEARRLGASSPIPHNEYGMYRLRRKDLDGAEAAFKKAIEVDPCWYDVHYNLGLVYRERGDMEAAQDEWVKELSANPGNADAMTLLRMVRGKARLAGAGTK